MGTIIGLLFLLFILGAIVWLVTGRERYRKDPRVGSPPGLQPTTEVFLDPETGRRQRVWFDPATGIREYRDE